jgi:DNA repair photolyase
LDIKLKNYTAIKELFENYLNRKTNGKMFKLVSETWNPITGCLYDCKYCWARDLALTKLKKSQRYQNGFKPSFNEKEFRVKFFKGDLIFVSDMGDLFGSFVESSWIEKVLDRIAVFPEADFLLLTKNPIRYHEFINKMPKNVILGTTIETNIDRIIKEHLVSKAPLPTKRFEAMKNLEWDRKMVSIEPILEFDLDILSSWIENIQPFLVYVGYDNYNGMMPEPLREKSLQLISRISSNRLVIKKTIRSAWFEGSQIRLSDSNATKR